MHGIFTPHAIVYNCHWEQVPCYQFFASNPRNENIPAIVLVHDRWGVSPDIILAAEFLKSQGFTVVIPDLYRGRRPLSHSEACSLREKLHIGLAIDDIAATVNELRVRNPFRSVGCVGFGGLGGEVALAAHHAFTSPEENFEACVILGSGLPNKRPPGPLKYPLQCHFAASDSIETKGVTQESKGRDGTACHGRDRALHHVVGKRKGVEGFRERCGGRGSEVSVYVYEGTEYGFLQEGQWFAKIREECGLTPAPPHITRLAWHRTISFLARHCKVNPDLVPNEEFEQDRREEIELTVRNLETEGAIPFIPGIPPKIGPLTYIEPDRLHLSKDEKTRIQLNHEMENPKTPEGRRREIEMLLGYRKREKMEDFVHNMSAYRMRKWRKNVRRKQGVKASKSPKLRKNRRIFWETNTDLCQAFEADPDDEGYVLSHPEVTRVDVSKTLKELLPTSKRKLPMRTLLYGKGLPAYSSERVETQQKAAENDIEHHRIQRNPLDSGRRKLPGVPTRSDDG
ncbi:hypothetical protein AAMO2058_001137100 [Amorphochlora amoebiformis]